MSPRVGRKWQCADVPSPSRGDVCTGTGATRYFYVRDEHDLISSAAARTAFALGAARAVVVSVLHDGGYIDVVARVADCGGELVVLKLDTECLDSEHLSRPHTTSNHPAVKAVRDHVGAGWQWISRTEEARYDTADSAGALTDVFQVRDATNVRTLTMEVPRVCPIVVAVWDVLPAARELAWRCAGRPKPRWTRRLRRW